MSGEGLGDCVCGVSIHDSVILLYGGDDGPPEDLHVGRLRRPCFAPLHASFRARDSQKTLECTKILSRRPEKLPRAHFQSLLKNVGLTRRGVRALSLDFQVSFGFLQKQVDEQPVTSASSVLRTTRPERCTFGPRAGQFGFSFCEIDEAVPTWFSLTCGSPRLSARRAYRPLHWQYCALSLVPSTLPPPRFDREHDRTG